MAELIFLIIAYFFLDWLLDDVTLRINGPRRSGGWRHWAFERNGNGVRLLGLNLMLKPAPRLIYSYDRFSDVMTINGMSFTGDFFRHWANPDDSRLYRFVESGTGIHNIEEIAFQSLNVVAGTTLILKTPHTLDSVTAERIRKTCLARIPHLADVLIVTGDISILFVAPSVPALTIDDLRGRILQRGIRASDITQ